MTPQQRGGGFGAPLLQRTALDRGSRACGIASKPTPTRESRSRSSCRRSSATTAAWRMQMRHADSESDDDRHGGRSQRQARRSGGAAVRRPRRAWIRWIHEGSHSGPLWAVVVFLTGILPTIFAVTGIMMWLRKRAGRKELAGEAP